MAVERLRLAVFAALAIGLAALATLQGNQEPVSRGPRWSQLVGVGMLAFGWFYPHFVAAGSPFIYLVAAPLGLIPCPTLSAVVGVALLANGLGNRPWSWTLGAAALFYAVFGVARLGVWLDVALFVGAVSLFVVARPRRYLHIGQGSGQPSVAL